MGRAEAPSGESARQVAAVDLTASLQRARLYLDALAPADAHRILEEALATPELPDAPASVRFDLLVLYVECCRMLGHADHLRRHAAELREYSEQHGGGSLDALVIASALLAWIDEEHGEYEAALDRCRRFGPDELERCSPQTAVRILMAEVNAHVRLGDYERAEVTTVRALDHACRSCDQALEGHVRAHMARLLKLRGRLRESLRLHSLAEGLHRRAGDFRSVSLDQLNRAMVLNRLGDLEEAERAIHESLRWAHGMGDGANRLRASLGLGMIEVRRGRVSAARRRLLSDWRDARRRGLKREECIALEFLGEAETLGGRLPRARAALGLCRRLAERIAPDGDLIAECDIRRTLLALTENDSSGAEDLARSAAALCERQDLVWEEAHARLMLGAALAMRVAETAEAAGSPNAASDVQRAEEVLADAREALERSRRLLESAGEQLDIVLVRRWIQLLQSVTAAELVARGPGMRWPAVHPGSMDGALEREGSQGCVPRAIATPGRRPAGIVQKPGPPELHPVWCRLGIVTSYAPLLAALEDARRLAGSGVNILILGETGTGKELLAHGVHQLRARNGERLIAFNCTTCPPELLDSELFGHVKGAFTGAYNDRLGLVRAAAGGSLFLDEIGELKEDSQARLLRFLDSGEIRPVGSDRALQVQVRIIAATNVPLEDRVARGRFRLDLYFRLAGGCVLLPPLRERAGDVPLLVRHFEQMARSSLRADFGGVGSRALREMERYDWPGNVRQLRSEIFRLAALTPSGLAVAQWSPPSAPSSDTTEGASSHATARSGVDPRERARILRSPDRMRQMLRDSGGHVTLVVRRLGVSRSHLYRVLRRHRLDPAMFRAR